MYFEIVFIALSEGHRVVVDPGALKVPSRNLSFSHGLDLLRMSESFGVIAKVLLERLGCIQKKGGNYYERSGPIRRCSVDTRSKHFVVLRKRRRLMKLSTVKYYIVCSVCNSK